MIALTHRTASSLRFPEASERLPVSPNKASQRARRTGAWQRCYVVGRWRCNRCLGRVHRSHYSRKQCAAPWTSPVSTRDSPYPALTLVRCCCPHPATLSWATAWFNEQLHKSIHVGLWTIMNLFFVVHVTIILPYLHFQNTEKNEVKVLAELDGKLRISVQ